MVDDRLPPACRRAREWLPAQQDEAAPQAAAVRAHVEACPACRGWSEAFTGLTRQARVRPAGDGPLTAQLVAPALAAWDARAAARRPAAARLVLGVAGVAGVVIACLGLLDVFGFFAKAGFHAGWELYSFEAALAVGFLLAAWRPERFTGGLLPVTAAVVLLVLVLTTTMAPTTPDLVREASHLPVLAGLFGLLLARGLGRRPRPARTLRPA